MNTLNVKLLKTAELIFEASALLYDVYIKEMQWKFLPDNPSNLRVTKENGRYVLLDKYTDNGIWFGAFEGDRLVGCARFTKADNNEFEIEGYSASVVIKDYLNHKNGLELGKVAAIGAYHEKKILHRLFLFAFEYCFSNGYDFFGATHNQYVKSIFSKIGVPLKVERAFKYEIHDPMEVNFYSASYANNELISIIDKLKQILHAGDNKNLTAKKFNILDALEMVAPVLPSLFYWHDKKGVVLGINESCLKAMGGTREKIIGHSPYDFYSKDVAEYILKHNEQVMRTGEVLSQEESINNITTGELLHGLSIKSPLYDEDGIIIGVVGTSIDITAEKETVKLRLDNQRHQAFAEAQAEFRKSVGQMIHDIRTPLSTLQMTLQSTREIPEEKRIALRDAAIAITDITGQLLKQYEPEDSFDGTVRERQIIVTSTLLASVVGDGRIRHKNKKIKFIYDVTPLNAFLFIKAEPSALKRSLSNLINNAVEAMPATGGKIEFKLSANEEWLSIKILDDGNGIPKDILDRIKKNEIVTHGKGNGHGIVVDFVNTIFYKLRDVKSPIVKHLNYHNVFTNFHNKHYLEFCNLKTDVFY